MGKGPSCQVFVVTLEWKSKKMLERRRQWKNSLWHQSYVLAYKRAQTGFALLLFCVGIHIAEMFGMLYSSIKLMDSILLPSLILSFNPLFPVWAREISEAVEEYKWINMLISPGNTMRSFSCVLFCLPFICLFVFPHSIGSSLTAKYASVSVGKIHGCAALNRKELLYSQPNSHPV